MQDLGASPEREGGRRHLHRELEPTIPVEGLLVSPELTQQLSLGGGSCRDPGGGLPERAAALADLFDWATQVQIQELALEAWIHFQAGESAEGLQRMEEAARLERTNEKHGVSPGNVLPAAELYGDMQMEAGLHGEALVAYERALERSPNRLNSLYGAGRAAEALDDTDTARAFYLRLTRQASESADLDRVRQAAAFLRGG